MCSTSGGAQVVSCVLLFLDLACEEIIQRRANDGDGAQLPDLGPTRRDRCSQNIRRKLKFERQGKKTGEGQTCLLVSFAFQPKQNVYQPSQRQHYPGTN